MFDTCLPHPRTLEKWYSSVDGKPGFTEAAFCALQARAAAQNDSLVCALLVDEMAIRQQIEWDGKHMTGYVDFGTGIDDDSVPVAREALTFMIVGVNCSFKIPVGYFLIAGLNGTEKANLINQCLRKLHVVGVTIASLTFDGAASNLNMAKILGCSLEWNENFKTSFPHPVTQQPVAIFLDVCHMLKLVRSTFCEKKSLVDGDNQFVDYQFIEKLHTLQNTEGLNLGNKLRSSHMLWFKKKMNVKLAAQLLSESVAQSLQFCRDENLPGFDGCTATIKFLQLFNKLFDIMNSRTLHSFGFKRPIQPSNESDIIQFLYEAKAYIFSLKESKFGRNILDSNRKTGFLGFAVCIDSLLSVYQFLIHSGRFGMHFLCTFKFSQDHLELFFGKVRSMGGFNNNPSARHFCAAYKRLLIHNDIQDVLRGNCLPLETVPILTVSSTSPAALALESPSLTLINDSCPRNRVADICDISEHSELEHNYAYVPSASHLSMCAKKIVVYIAGFVVFKLKQTMRCETCVESLSSSDNNDLCSLIKLKSKGHLIHPSTDVIDICLTCEESFRKHVKCQGPFSHSVCVNALHRQASF